MKEKELKEIMTKAEEKVFDFLTEEGKMPAMAFLVCPEGLMVLPMPIKSKTELPTKAALLRRTMNETNAEAVVYVTEASVRKRNCIIIAGSSEAKKIIRTLPFKRRGKDILFDQEIPGAITQATPFSHPVVDTM